ncbi:hypothetical protein B0H10DRAFT_1939539 [Mycena sp. CBHHK59/15]|nr:hypothetical protein B0H10DRAFT_1939539 [Mycena sp. CBHHK59/15]
MAPRNVVKHLGSEDHKKALGLFENVKRKRKESEKERLAQFAAKDLRDLRFAAAPNVRGPIASGSSSRGPSLAETEMWEEYALNGADFDAGDDTEDPHVQHEKLREEARTFGLWNPDGVARQLGLGDEDVAAQILEDDGEEDFLAEIMRNADECLEREMARVSHSLSRQLADPKRWIWLCCRRSEQASIREIKVQDPPITHLWTSLPTVKRCFPRGKKKKRNYSAFGKP